MGQCNPGLGATNELMIRQVDWAETPPWRALPGSCRVTESGFGATDIR